MYAARIRYQDVLIPFYELRMCTFSHSLAVLYRHFLRMTCKEIKTYKSFECGMDFYCSPPSPHNSKHSQWHLHKKNVDAFKAWHLLDYCRNFYCGMEKKTSHIYRYAVRSKSSCIYFYDFLFHSKYITNIIFFFSAIQEYSLF